MKKCTCFLVDGKEYVGYEPAAAAIGSTVKSLTNYLYTKEKEHGRGYGFTLRGHTVQRKLDAGITKARPKSPREPVLIKPEQTPIEVMASIPAVTAMVTPAELLAIEFRSVKEELRYLRECLIGRLHGLDEISEHVRSIEARVIESKKVHGSFTAGHYGTEGLGAEKLG
jgi:hypothetical protein